MTLDDSHAVPRCSHPDCTDRLCCYPGQGVDGCHEGEDRGSPHALGAIPDYPTDVLPSAARSLVAAGAKDGLPASLLGGAALAALASAAGASVQLELTPRWHERAILWIPLIAPRGAGKSPAQELAFAPIRAHDAQLDDDAVPVLRGDMTMEALVRVLKKADGTAALEVDELATFIRGIGEYKRGGGDRGRVLSLWTGAPWPYVRVGSGGSDTNSIDIRITRPTIVICGGLQTSLHDLLGGDDDGMRPRWLPHVAQLPDVGKLSANGKHPADWQTLLGAGLLPIRADQRTWKLNESGHAAFNAHRMRWKQQARDADSQSVSAALTKADTHLARIALVFAEADAPGHGGDVDGDVVERAAALVEFTLDCWRSLPEHGSLGLSARDMKLDDGVERLRSWLEDHGGESDRRQLQRAHVAGARTVSDLDALLRRYADTYPGCVTQMERGGNTATVVRAPVRRPPNTPAYTRVSPVATPSRRTSSSPHEHKQSDGVTSGDPNGDTPNGDTFPGAVNGKRLLPGDPGYLHQLSIAKQAGHVTEGEWNQLSDVHTRLAENVA